MDMDQSRATLVLWEQTQTWDRMFVAPHLGLHAFSAVVCRSELCPVWSLHYPSLGSWRHDLERTISDQQKSTLLLCSGGLNEEEINHMEKKKNRQKGRSEIGEGWVEVTENRLRVLSTDWIWSMEKVRRLEKRGLVKPLRGMGTETAGLTVQMSASPKWLEPALRLGHQIQELSVSPSFPL